MGAWEPRLLQLDAGPPRRVYVLPPDLLYVLKEKAGQRAPGSAQFCCLVAPEPREGTGCHALYPPSHPRMPAALIPYSFDVGPRLSARIKGKKRKKHLTTRCRPLSPRFALQ